MQTVRNLSTSNSEAVNKKYQTAGFIVLSVIFLALVLVMFLLMTALLQTPGSAVDRKRAIEQRPANSIDTLIIGNSHAYCTFDPAVMEQITGKRVFNAGMPDQKIDIMYYNLLETLKTQKPDTIIMEGFAFGRSDSTYQGYIADMDAIDPGFGKLKACLEIYPDKYDAFRMFASLYRSHNNWKKPSIIKGNLKYLLGMDKTDKRFNGFYTLSSKMSDKTLQKYKDVESIKFAPVIDDYTSDYFRRIVKLCRERGIRLIVTMAPFNDVYQEKVHYAAFNEKLSELTKSEGVELVDFNMLYKEVGIEYADFEDAFHHAQHMNKWGAEKVSKYMAEYLMRK
ncbi:MAG TPA: hypothetical protein VHT96_13205 [Clostridia bacterium]|nr:hypothetical protein [Clostridia bacterium]